MASSLWKMINYKTKNKYLINTYIREYDLSKANINALLYMGKITEKEYNNLLVMPKQDREIYVGLMIKKDYSIYKVIQTGIIEAKRRLIQSNDIEDYEIVSIKNDAVFVHGRLLNEIIFPPFEFKIKNEYTVYLQLEELEIYYGDTINPDGTVSTNIDIKGIDDSKLVLHQNGILDLICEVCYRLQRQSAKDIIPWISNIFDKYINRQMPKEYYRSFDSISKYIIDTNFMSCASDYIEDSAIPVINIDRNLLIIRDLFSIISSIYSVNIKKR